MAKSPRTPPAAVINGVSYWNWKKSASRSEWKLASIDEMMSQFGGSYVDWLKIVDGYSHVGPDGWRLIISRRT